jgi:putative membrane protein
VIFNPEPVTQADPFRERVAMMWWYGAHWGFWQATVMWAGMIVFWGLLIWGIYALISSANRKRGGEEPGRDARRVLDERLARGEINPEEYQRLRDLISSEGKRTPVSSEKAS